METGVPLQAFRVFTGEWVWVGIDHQHQAGSAPSETSVQSVCRWWVWMGIDCHHQTGDTAREGGGIVFRTLCVAGLAFFGQSKPATDQ